MSTHYLSSGAPTATTSRHGNILSRLIKPILLVLAAVIVSTTALSGAVHDKHQQAEAFDITKFVMCMWGKDSVPGKIYQATQSSDVPFMLQSKSTMNFGVDDVDGGLNKVIGLFGNDYNKTNSKILGRNIDPDYTDKAGKKATFNSGKKVNPFDRFGVSGLKFTSYTGEWKHVIIDACGDDDKPKDPHANKYYKDRLEPQSTWEDVSTSKDVRTKQFDKNFGAKYSTSLATMTANGVFMIPKAMVATTAALINFAFSDVAKHMGLDNFVFGENGEGGIFKTLYDHFFLPLLGVVFGITGIWIAYMALARQRVRESFVGLTRAIVMLFIAVIIAASPGKILSVPNNIAVTIQSLTISAMDKTISSQGDLCTTDVGSTSKSLEGKGESKQSQIEQTSKNMRSTVNCTFWTTLLVKPWSQGQFGTDWNNLWVKGKTPQWAQDNDAKTVSNTNGDMVGKAGVPVGEKTSLNNWALFQLSAQTNAHSPVAHHGKLSKYSNGSANDWWRIVDAMSNYQETTKTAKGAGDEGGDKEYKVPDNSKEAQPTSEWNTWAGNSPWHRVGTALSAALVATIALAAPFVFALMAAVYSLGLIVLMIPAPIMFLFGAGTGRLWEIFKGWGELVINVTLKRIAMGLLLTFSIITIMLAIDKMENEGWWRGILLLILLSIVLLVSRGKLVGLMASVRIGGADLMSGASKMTQGIKGAGKTAAGTAMASTAGAVAAKRAGGSAVKGAGSGMKQEMRSSLYKSNSARPVVASYEAGRIQRQGKTPGTMMQDGEQAGTMYCASCGRPIGDESQGTEQVVSRDDAGNYYCKQCTDDGATPSGTRETVLDFSEQQQQDTPRQQRSERPKSSAFNRKRARNYRERIRHEDMSSEKREELLGIVTKGVSFDIADAKQASRNGESTAVPDIPNEIVPYVDKETVNSAWREGNYDYLQAAYTVAWATWYQDETGEELSQSLEQLTQDVAAFTDQKSDEGTQSHGSSGRNGTTEE